MRKLIFFWKRKFWCIFYIQKISHQLKWASFTKNNCRFESHSIVKITGKHVAPFFQLVSSNSHPMKRQMGYVTVCTHWSVEELQMDSEIPQTYHKVTFIYLALLRRMICYFLYFLVCKCKVENSRMSNSNMQTMIFSESVFWRVIRHVIK